jgi:hypothetical protein
MTHPRKKRKDEEHVLVRPDSQRLAMLEREDPVAGIPGPGRWLVVDYQPTSLFSLKTSQATSSVGVSLVIPTPYAVKMALVDAAFRVGINMSQCAGLFRSLAPVDVRIAPSPAAIITNTFVKIRQEPKTPSPQSPYISSIAYRELVYLSGTWSWAFDLVCCDDMLAEQLVTLAPHVNYIGKRGSFVQYLGRTYRRTDLGSGFTQPIQGEKVATPARSHVRVLDDFGPDANLETLSSFTSTPVKRGKHRRFIETVIPVGLSNTGPGFSEYRFE